MLDAGYDWLNGHYLSAGEYFIEHFTNDYVSGEGLFFTLSAWLANFCGFWVPNFVLFIVYQFDLFSSWKIEPNKFPSRELVMKSIWANIISTFISYPVLAYFIIYPYYFQGKVVVPLPSFLEGLTYFVGYFLWADFSFYWLHRFFHWPPIYKRWHKQHHGVTTTFGVAATYAHPMEDILVSGISTLAAPLMYPAHPFVLWIFLILRIEESVEEHSGYNIKCSPWRLLRSTEHHAYHHSHNLGAYGTFFWCDQIFGTDGHYNKWKEEQNAKKEKLALAQSKENAGKAMNGKNVANSGGKNLNGRTLTAQNGKHQNNNGSKKIK